MQEETMQLEMLAEEFRRLKLPGMARGLERMGDERDHDLTFEERLTLLITQERQHRENRRLANLIQKAKFKYPKACMEEIDYNASRGLRKSEVLTLVQNEWLRKKQNVIATGPTGAGKSYLACALGNSACREGFTAFYIRMPRLIQDLALARADGSYYKLIAKFSRINLLIIDDWGVSPLGDKERRDILEIVEDRYDVQSTVIVAQIPIESWHIFIGDPTIADAICDRLVHNAHRIKLKGGSMRKAKSELTEVEQETIMEAED